MANEKRLIDANAFKIFLEEVRQDYLEEDTCSSDFAAKVLETVQDEYLALAPTVDAVEVVHGRWVEFNAFMTCSECDTDWYYIDNNTDRFDYCPNCLTRQSCNAGQRILFLRRKERQWLMYMK